METSPGRVIRMLREGLDMSQAEFARALDWSPSTISAWERGRAQPSRLAFKVILAFAEERGVRYRPKLPARDLVPIAYRAPEPFALPVPVPASGVPRERVVTVTAERPRWSAQATFRVSGAAGATGGRRSLGSMVSTLGIAATTLCAALALGLPGSARHASPPPAPTAQRQPPPATHREGAASPAAEPAHALASAVAAAPVARAAAPAAPVVRLDGLVLVGGRHRATFRTDGDSVTVPEGSRIGAQRVTAITPDRVELETPSGETRTVRLGHGAALE